MNASALSDTSAGPAGIPGRLDGMAAQATGRLQRAVQAFLRCRPADAREVADEALALRDAEVAVDRDILDALVALGPHADSALPGWLKASAALERAGHEATRIARLAAARPQSARHAPAPLELRLQCAAACHRLQRAVAALRTADACAAAALLQEGRRSDRERTGFDHRLVAHMVGAAGRSDAQRELLCVARAIEAFDTQARRIAGLALGKVGAPARRTA